MRRRNAVVILIAFFLLFSLRGRLVQASGESPGGLPWDSPMKRLEESGLTGPIDAIYQRISGEGQVHWRDILSGVLAGKGVDIKGVLAKVTGGALRDLISQTGVLGRLVLLVIVFACLDVLTETFAPEGVNRIASWACQISLVLLAVFSFRDVLTVASGAVETLQSTFFAFVPALTGLSLVSGAPITGSVLQPLVFAMGSVASVFVLDVAFPLLYTSIALDMAGSLTGESRVRGIAGLLKGVATIGTGTLMACFVGVVVGQKAASGMADGVAFRTAKYVSSTFVPVAGKALGDTMELFFVSAYGLKSALGITGCIVVLGAVFSPFLKVVACLAVWKVASAIADPLSGASARSALKTMTGGIGLLAVTLLITSFVFTICLFLVSQAARPF